METCCERHHLLDLAYLYGRAMDGRTRGEYAIFDQCMLADVEVDYEFGSWQGLETHKRIIEKIILDVFSFTHHTISNSLVRIDGDSASGEHRVTGAHGLMVAGTQRVVWGGAIYKQRYVRTAAGWRISEHCCERAWIDDDGSVGAIVSQAYSKAVATESKRFA